MPIDLSCREAVQIFITGKGLKKIHLMGNADGFARLYHINPINQAYELVGETEVILNNSDPVWTTPFVFEYRFEEKQEMALQVLDKEGEDKSICLGELRFTMCQLMRSKFAVMTQECNAGNFTVRGEPLDDTRDVIEVTWKGNKLVNKDSFFDKSDPYIIASRQNEDGSLTKIWQSVQIENNLNPQFNKLRISVADLANGDRDRPIQWELWDKDKYNADDSMGKVHASINRIISHNGQPLDVIEDDKKGSSGYTNSGTLTPTALLEKHPCFVDFVKGGCEISLVVAIDFTASNGNPTQSSSLHYIDPAGLIQNEYEKCIRIVGDIVETYDTDKQFGVYGFGARLDGHVNHCFAVSPDGGVQGVSGVLDCYKKKLKEVELSGPTLLAPILGSLRGQLARNPCTQEKQKYTVLLVIADGSINDMDETIEELIALCDYPCSVSIVGVGDADFSDMNTLDAKKKKLSSGGKSASRDIVSFTSYREMTKTGVSIFDLANCLMSEIPDHLLAFMEGKGILPNKVAGSGPVEVK